MSRDVKMWRRYAYGGIVWHAIVDLETSTTACGFTMPDGKQIDSRPPQLGLTRWDLCGVCEGQIACWSLDGVDLIDDEPIVKPEPMWSPNPWHR